jgi:Peptidase family M23
MQVIIISPNNKTHKHWHLSRTKLMILSSLIIALIAISAHSTMNYWQNATQTQDNVHALKSTATPQTFAQSSSSEQDATFVNNFYAKRLGQLQAQAIRLNALTEELANMSGLDVSQFLLKENIAQGGIEKQGDDLSSQEFNDELQQLSLGDHGNGYVTRYAHNKTINVKVGNKVNKGQILALMGSTGRSTGPHVHFEVLRDGKNINPYSFVKR